MLRRCFLAAAALVGLLSLGLTAQAQTVITQWNFNQTGFDVNSPAPSTGVGIASLLSGVTGSSASGTANGGSSDLGSPNTAWGTTGYPAQGTGSGTAGVRFDVSTVGFQDIVIQFDLRKSNTSSRWVELQYTTDGTNFTPFQQYQGPLGDTWFNNQIADLSAVAGVADNPNFGVRMVSIFDPAAAGVYTASNTTSTYASTGTLRYDMVTFSGTAAAVPEPTTLALGGLGMGITLVAYRIKRRRRGAKK